MRIRYSTVRSLGYDDEAAELFSEFSERFGKHSFPVNQEVASFCAERGWCIHSGVEVLKKVGRMSRQAQVAFDRSRQEFDFDYADNNHGCLYTDYEKASWNWLLQYYIRWEKRRKAR